MGARTVISRLSFHFGFEGWIYIYLHTYDVMHVMKGISKHQISRHPPINNAEMQNRLLKEGEVFFKRQFERQINFNSSSSLNTANLCFYVNCLDCTDYPLSYCNVKTQPPERI